MIAAMALRLFYLIFSRLLDSLTLLSWALALVASGLVLAGQPFDQRD
jgi:hypothetical protein